jgi:hypothetical protein
MDPSLHDIIKAGYGNKKYKEKLKKFGYNIDNKLSSGNHQVYYNDKNKKLLFNVTGTHNASDWITDGYLAVGKLKNTTRYKEADKMLKIARDRYKPSNVSVTGHSLGGSIAGYISGKNDKVLTLDKEATIGQKIRNNENALRTSGDLVSLLNANSKHMTTLKNPNYSTGIMPIDIIILLYDILNVFYYKLIFLIMFKYYYF